MKEDNRNAEIVFDPILNLGFAQGEGIGVRSVLGFPSVGYNSVLIAGILINSWRQPVGISQKMGATTSNVQRKYDLKNAT